jgi:hypothetical protein
MALTVIIILMIEITCWHEYMVKHSRENVTCVAIHPKHFVIEVDFCGKAFMPVYFLAVSLAFNTDKGCCCPPNQCGLWMRRLGIDLSKISLSICILVGKSTIVIHIYLLFGPRIY